MLLKCKLHSLMFVDSAAGIVGNVGDVGGLFNVQQHACASQGAICSDNYTCCHTEIEAAAQDFYLIKSQYTDTGPTSPGTSLLHQAPSRVSSWITNV